MIETKIIIKIPFHDIDPMEIVWHGNYVKYFEMARADLLDKIDYNYEQMRQSFYAWPVIDLKLRYINPATYGQEICVHASLTEYENRMKVDYLISDVKTGKKLTKGYTVQVAVDMRNNEMCLASPDILLEKLGIK